MPYFYRRGSVLERAAVLNALTYVDSRSLPYYQQNEGLKEPDVSFSLKESKDVYIGQPFEIYLNMQSHSSSQARNVTIKVDIYTTFYTGIRAHKVKERRFQVTVMPNKNAQCTVEVKPEDYLHLLVEQCAFRIAVIAQVAETKQPFVIEDSFIVMLPKVAVQAFPPYQVGRPFDVDCALKNPLPNITLHGCKFSLQGPGIEKSREITCRDIVPGGEAKITTTCTPSKSGDRVLMVRFSANELAGRPDGSTHISIWP